MLYIKYSTAGDGNDCEDIPKGLIAAPSPARIFLEDIFMLTSLKFGNIIFDATNNLFGNIYL